ncbi:MAG: toll/interleukin-1 receptor domain-containing protein [Acidobacteriota bacterium]|nr:toll/interleukin-1 receptor domain-containing protein [Acidobacteriota bacterium]
MSYFASRAAVAAACLVLTGVADLWFVRRPEPHSVAEFSPFTARVGSEELILTRPESVNGPLLTHDGAPNEVVEIFFDRASIIDESTAPQSINYMAGDDPPGAKGSPCRSTLHASLEHSDTAELRLFQRGLPGGVHRREIEIKPTGSPLLFEFQTMGDPSLTNQPGCNKILQVGDTERTVMQHLVRVRSEAGSAVRLKFMPASGTPNWDGPGGMFEPFQAISLKARDVRVSPIGSPQILRRVRAAAAGAPIEIGNLLIGSDVLQGVISGVGWVSMDGREVGPTFNEWISGSYLRAAAAAFVNLLVLVGVAALVFRGRRLKLPVGAEPGEIFANPSGGLRVFLCHCSEDKPTVRDLNVRLLRDRFQPWLDERDILPARHWDEEIKEALSRSDAVVICLSKLFVRKEGFVQRELRYALERAEEKPEEAIFLIPVRLEPCDIPVKLRGVQCIDLFAPEGYAKLTNALRERSRQLGTDKALA